MPRSIQLKPEPTIQFGVWDRHGRAYTTSVPDYSYERPRVGYKIEPFFGYSGSNMYETVADAEVQLPQQRELWASNRLSMKRNALDMTDVLVDRFMARLAPRSGGWGWDVVFMDGTSCIIEPTRGYVNAEMEGPREGPLLVKRILANQRTFRLDEGRSLAFNKKLQLRTDSVPEWIVDQIFPL